ncbi:hypothetical protein [Marinitenerispora sediminis]|uniref:hypothetical protein n=1 Tax=Marinitenerispora sediminis TaxID=1931232 RepID=UPI0011C07522|nr:hypothetical protein [Marinitenerispora sediminis]
MFRALATLLTAVLVTVSAPVLPLAAVAQLVAPAAPTAPSEHRTAMVGFGPHAVVGPAQDSTSVSLALAKWGGDQRPLARDLPDGYLPGRAELPGRGRWEHVPPAGAVAGPETAGARTLPLGRAPPPTTRT